MLKTMIHKYGFTFIALLAILLAILAPGISSAQAHSVADPPDLPLAETPIERENVEIDWLIADGTPPDTQAAVAVLPQAFNSLSANMLPEVPAFYWSYGCAPTAAAMLFGYYDRTGYSNMYSGPTNDGVCPPDNRVWGETEYPSGFISGECPLSATHQGIDGRTAPGHVDSYWVDYLSWAPDPYETHGWMPHEHGDCTADFMGTSQRDFGNIDGSTMFVFWTNGNPTYDYTDGEPDERDGCHGMRLFAESRGYNVVTNYNQYIMDRASANPFNGFTFADYVAEIDAGRPVMIHVQGHSMLGFGYNLSGDIVYLYDTWDHDPHSMAWGGMYGVDGNYYQHIAVTVIELEPVTAVPPESHPVTLATDPPGVSLVIDGQTYPPQELPAVFSWEQDSDHRIEAPLTVHVSDGTRYVFTSWSDGHTSATRTITVSEEAAYTANYTTQHYLTVTCGYGTPSGEGWYDRGTNTAVAASETIARADTRYIFSRWSVDGRDASNRSAMTVVMDAPHTAATHYRTQYYLTVESDFGTPSGEGWYDRGARAVVETDGIVGDGQTRHVFQAWTVNGDRLTGNRASLTMDVPYVAVAGYRTQHYLTVNSEYGDPSGQGWYDEGETAAASVTSPVGTIVRKVFIQWSGDSTATTPVTFTPMDDPKSIKAEWRDDYLYLYLIVLGIVIVVAAGASLLLTRRKRKKRPRRVRTR